MSLSVYKESTQNSLSLNTVGTSNRRQFLCSENEICFKPAFCPKLELSLPFWIFSRTIHAAGTSLAGSGSFLTAFLLDSRHAHTYALVSTSHLCLQIVWKKAFWLIRIRLSLESCWSVTQIAFSTVSSLAKHKRYLKIFVVGFIWESTSQLYWS